MKTRRIQMIMRQWMAVVVVLALGPWSWSAMAAGTLDEKLSQVADRSTPTPVDAKNPGTKEKNPFRLDYMEVEKIPIDEMVGSDGKWYAIAYEANPEQYENLQDNETPAKLCFLQEPDKTAQQCFEAWPADGFSSTCQYVGELSVVPVFRTKFPQKAVLFRADSFRGGSGYGRLITLWTFSEKSKKFINILPEITVGTQDEYKLLGGRGDTLDGTLVVARVTYGEGDDKFSPHHYQIMIYQHDKTVEQFRVVGKYVTKTKYESPDKTEAPADVISHEIAKVQEAVQKGSEK